MSHYRSGQYYVELNKRKAIESECQKKLQQVQQEREAARAEADRVKRELAHNEEYLGIQAQQMRRDADHIRTQQQIEAEQLKEQAQQALARLDEASMRLLTVYRNDPAAEDLRVQVEQLHQMLQLGHDPAQLIERVEEFIRTELPAWENKLRIQDEQRSARQSAAHLTRISSTAGDYSESFVSLKKKREKQQNVRKTPWESFCSRVQALMDQQQDMATDELLQLAEEMERTAPEEQKRFMIGNLQLLEELEADAAAVAEMLTQADEELDGQIRRYEALCSLLELIPERKYTEEADAQTYALLASENDRLWQLYLLRREEEYVDRNLEEVFAKYNIRFDNLETSASENGSVQMRCELSGSTRLTMTKSSGGAFEIEFTGVSSASTASLDERRRIAAEARSFCSMMPQITAELAAGGILIRSSYEEAPTAENIRIEHRAALNVIYEEKALRTMK